MPSRRKARSFSNVWVKSIKLVWAVLAVVRTAPEIFVGRAGQGQFLFQRLDFQVVLENGFEAGIGTGAEVQGAPTSSFQAVMAHGFAQADDSQGGAKALFGMRPV